MRNPQPSKAIPHPVENIRAHRAPHTKPGFQTFRASADYVSWKEANVVDGMRLFLEPGLGVFVKAAIKFGDDEDLVGALGLAKG